MYLFLQINAKMCIFWLFLAFISVLYSKTLMCWAKSRGGGLLLDMFLDDQKGRFSTTSTSIDLSKPSFHHMTCNWNVRCQIEILINLKEWSRWNIICFRGFFFIVKASIWSAVSSDETTYSGMLIGFHPKRALFYMKRSFIRLSFLLKKKTNRLLICLVSFVSSRD